MMVECVRHPYRLHTTVTSNLAGDSGPAGEAVDHMRVESPRRNAGVAMATSLTV